MPEQICVIDGQRGGIGATVIKHIKDALEGAVILIALGTNNTASAAMLEAGANLVATGEKSICKAVDDADIIIGPVGITWPNAMMGEVTANIAEAVMSSYAYKILLPFNHESAEIVGLVEEPLTNVAEKTVTHVKAVLKNV